MDYLDLIAGRYQQVCVGHFFAEKPKFDINPVPVDFDYEPIDATEWHYKQLIGNLNEVKAASAVIKTFENIGFKPGTYCTLQDGRLYIVLDVTDDIHRAQKEAMRILPYPVQVDHVIRLQEVENPWGIV